MDGKMIVSMPMSLRYSVIIPAYNEVRSIARAIAETYAAFSRFGEPFEIIVVDDGSRDETRAMVEGASKAFPGVVLIRHERNQGKGAAVKTGVAAAQGEIFLFLDADLATHPSEFEQCIPLFGAHDIVIGSRRTAGAEIVEGQPWHRVLAGRTFNAIIRGYLGLPFLDTQCGFKAFKANAKPLFAELGTSGWVFDVELLGQAMKRGMRIAEVPVAWKNGRESRVKIGDAGKIIQELRAVRRRLRS
jgi:dolichyl-phosphate beta-glucosyltransferase